MTKTTEKEKTVTITAQDRGETMAYALQSGVYNLAANLYEPYISYRIQRHYAPPHSKPTSYGNYTQNLAGEFAGDIIGAGTLMVAEAFIPEQLHTFTRSLRSKIDPLYSSVAKHVFSKQLNSPDYEQKVKEWKDFQERNLVRFMIMASASILGNDAVQKHLLNNPSPTGLVVAGKLASRALTMGVGLTARMAFPDHFDRTDEWIGKKLFAPMMDSKQIDLSDDPPPAVTHAERLTASREESDKLLTR